MRKPSAIARGKKTYRDRIEGRIMVERFANATEKMLCEGRALLRRTANTSLLAVLHLRRASLKRQVARRHRGREAGEGH